MFRPSLLIVFSVACIPAIANAQGLCPTDATGAKLICLIPQIYDAKGGVPVEVTSQAGAPVTNNFQDATGGLVGSLRPLNSSIARQAAILPLASPSSGITFAWSAAAKAPVPSTDSYGPILGERADTIGKYRVSLGFSYQFFQFQDLDGVTLKNLPSVLLQNDDTVSVPGRTCSITGDNQTQCALIRDVVKADNRVDLRVHQFTTFITLGITDRIDFSVAIPIENVRMRMSSNTTLVNNMDSTGTVFAHTFPFRPGCGDFSTTPPTPCASESFSNTGAASGIGDLTLRVKGTASKGERSGLALGVDVRVPTGDSLNFLGAGAVGVRPFVVWSYRSRISPHASVGYEVNGSSKIAGDILTGTKDKLPSQLTYTGGADVWITKRLTAAFDFIGQQVFQAQRISPATVIEPAACADTINPGQCASGDFLMPKVDPAVAPTTGTYNVTHASLGAKFRPISNLLITGNVLIQLNNGGLGAKTIPLVGVSYTF